VVAGGGGDHQAHLLPLHPRLFPFPVTFESAAAAVAQPEQVEPLALVVEDKVKKGRRQSDEEVASEPAIKVSPTKSRPEAKTKKEATVSSELPITAIRRRQNVKAKSKSAVVAHEAIKQEEGVNSGTSEHEQTRHQQQQRNYKNLTRERRVEANARERQRVHTITAAFETLQAAIPSEDENAKLSKLSVIKIATAYIMALSRMAGYDYTEDQSAPSLETVIQHCQEVIHTETRIKKRGSQS
jgi:hypothetical protein